MNLEGTVVGIKPGAWMWISAAITVGLFLPCWFLELHPLTWLVAMFYGPLIASYQSRENVVWKSALGGLLGMAAVVLIAATIEWSETKALFGNVGGDRVEYNRWGDAIDPASTPRRIFGIPILFACVFPFCLIGSSVGEHLSIWRRKREAECVAGGPLEQVQPRKMTDEEIANTKL